MRFSSLPSAKHRRLLPMFAIAIALSGAASCTDKPSISESESAASPASLSLTARVAKLPDGGPQIVLGSMTGILTDANGNQTKVSGLCHGDYANLRFDVQVWGSSDAFTLDIMAYDTEGVLAYVHSQTLTVKSGANADISLPTLPYAGPDKAVASLRLSPRTLLLAAGGSGTFSTAAAEAGGGTVGSVRVGWTSRNPSVATVDNRGVVRAGTQTGATYIVARSASNAVDSVLVTVHGPVDKVLVTPTVAQVIRGGSVTLLAQLVDVANVATTDQTVAWTTSDASVATVTATGVVTAIKTGIATITATANGKMGSVVVTVVTPLDHIELTPATMTLASVNETKSLTTKLVAAPGGSTTGITSTFASSDPKVATVGPTGVVTAVANGTATITATAEGMIATTKVTVKQVAVTVTVSPKSGSVLSFGDRVQFAAVAVDALGTQIVDAVFTWTSSDTTVASVNAGSAIGLKAGTATITAASDGKSATALFIVAPAVKTLMVTVSKQSIAVSGTAVAVARYGDAYGNPIADVSAAWSTTTPSIVQVSQSGVITGVSAGTGTITATAGALTASASIRVTGSGGGGGLILNLTSVEKLPRGTSEFFVVSGGDGPFTWTVNGIPNGNATFGTIVSDGGHAFYTAPGSVPNPSTFDVCATQATPPAFGCAHVTISAIPSGGADVIVFNDVNTFVDPGSGDANNLKMFGNLVSFSGAGARTSQHGVMFYLGHASAYVVTGSSVLGTTIRNLGYSTTDNYSPLTQAIDPSVKVIFLWLPMTSFSTVEINNMKQFAAEGGRIIFVGEHAGYYGSGIPIENQFFIDMGARMTNSGGAYDCGFAVEPASRLRAHQVTAGLTQLTIACASEVVPGPNDYALLYDLTGTHVLAAVAKIDVTPLPLARASLRGALRTMKAAPAIRVNLSVPSGINPKDPAGRPLPIKP